MTEGLISVIVPVHNSEKHLEECINSILAQTYTNIEVILVDDGSTDDSVVICDAFAERNSRVKVLQVPNCSVSTARNAGVDVAKGEFMCFVDSDDTIEADMYEIMHKSLTESDADICICGLKEVSTNGIFVTVLPFEDRQSPKAFFEGYLKAPPKYASFLYGGPTKTLSRSHIFTKSLVRFNPSLANNGGPEFNASCVAAATDGVVFVNRALYNYCTRSDSMLTTLTSEDIATMIKSMGEVIKSTLPEKVDTIDTLISTEYNTLVIVSVGRAKLRRLPPPFKLDWATVAVVLKHSSSFYMKVNALCTYLLPGFCYRGISAIAFKLFAPYGKKKI